MRARQGGEIPAPLDPGLRAGYLRLIEDGFGLRLTDHQARGLDDALARLLVSSGIATPRELLDLLAVGQRQDLLRELVGELAVGETHFFRVASQIDALRQVVLPDLAERRWAQRRLRIWSAGCSTGEEPYTLAILLRQQFPASRGWNLQLLATDLSSSALEIARAALYGEWSFRETPEEVRRSFFVLEGGRWRLVEPIRSMVRFSRLNLVADSFPPPGPDGRDFDLILCRNVTIYFASEAAQDLYRRFAGALEPGGWLVLGPSDPPPCQPGPLEPVWLPGAVLWRRPREHRAATRGPAADSSVPDRARDSSTSARGGQVAGAPGPGLPAGGSNGRAAIPHGGPSLGASALDRAWALAHAGERREARRLGEEMVRARPLEAEVHLLLGMLSLEEGADAAAVESLRRATFLAPDHPLAQFGLGRAYLRLGNERRALAALSQARRLLATVSADEVVARSGGLRASELRHAVEVWLAGLKRANGAEAPGG